MATPASGRPATYKTVQEAVRWSESDAAKIRSDAIQRNLDAQAGRPPFPEALNKEVPLRYRAPDSFKGALYALDPDDHTQGDALLFSRYPETLDEEIESILAADSPPGRAYPAFQQMGAKGVQLSTELWFCDAFMWRWKGLNGPMQQMLGPLATDTSLRSAEPLGTLAEQARRFFEFYIAGHDGTGVALPPADLYLQWGSRPAPLPIVIKRVSLKLENFTNPGGPLEDVRGGAGAPQTVTARLEMEVNIPLRAINPFQPRKPKPPGGGMKKVRCPTGTGFGPDFRPVVQAIMEASPLSNEVFDLNLQESDVRGYFGLGPKGFAAP